ncbi:MAG: hypothetical protein EOP48_03950 [Sphingobacteriales bacterium]|nr:MAG: hypothetical protein EOP48_03950 [Sphingobacteriales bacterium]
MKLNFLFCVVFVVAGCADSNKQSSKNTMDSVLSKESDSSIFSNEKYVTEQEFLAEKALLCGSLSLYNLSSQDVNFELRLWNFPSMWDPSILYVLKRHDSVWTLFHYEYYRMRILPRNYKAGPIVDSVVMESLIPLEESWVSYIANLRLDSLWSMKTESDIKDKQFNVVDGSRSLLELREGPKYKYLFYTMPQAFVDKDINHKQFVAFRERLIQPLLYNGIRNP